MCSYRVLVLGAGQFYIESIQKLKDHGFTVFSVDRNPDAPGFQFSDKYAVVDISDREGVLNYAETQKVDAIMPLNDFGTRAAFYACQKLGMIGNSYLSGICGNDKGMMRDVWAHEKLPQPRYRIFSRDTPVKDIARSLDFPMVVKPTDCGGGGRGISVAQNETELKEAINFACPYTWNNRLIAESFMQGIEVTVDSLIYKGKTYVLAISDKIKPNSRFRVATSLNFPAFFPADVITRISNIVARASEALGVSNGATHAELIVSPDRQEITLVEMGLRGGGGHLFSTIIEEVSGVCAPAELAKILCGATPNLQKTKKQGCVYRFFNPPGQGVLKKVEMDENLLQQPFVAKFGLTIKPGEKFYGLSDSLKRIGFVVTRGKDRDEAVKNADIIESSVKFEFHNT